MFFFSQLATIISVYTNRQAYTLTWCPFAQKGLTGLYWVSLWLWETWY